MEVVWHLLEGRLVIVCAGTQTVGPPYNLHHYIITMAMIQGRMVTSRHWRGNHIDATACHTAAVHATCLHRASCHGFQATLNPVGSSFTIRHNRCTRDTCDSSGVRSCLCTGPLSYSMLCVGHVLFLLTFAGAAWRGGTCVRTTGNRRKRRLRARHQQQ